MFFNSKKKKIFKLLEQFQAQPEGERQAIVDNILEQKEIALPIFLKELKKSKAKFDWQTIGGLLSQMGDFSFDAVLEIFTQNKKNTKEKALWVLERYGDTAKQKVMQHLSHQSPIIKNTMAIAIQNAQNFPKSAIDALIPCLADRNLELRNNAVGAIETLGKNVVKPLLNTRKKADKKLRKGALVALLSTFPEQISDFDKTLIARLDRMTAKHDQAIPFAENSWLAIPKTSVENIVEWCDLKTPAIVPFQKGLDAVIGDLDYIKGDIEQPSKTRVFITPVINDKWMFVIGDFWHIGDTAGQSRVNQILEKISKELGEAFCFTNHNKTSNYAWTIAEQGKIIRQHLGPQALLDEGVPTPPEQRIRGYKVKNDETIDDNALQDWLPVIANYYCLYPEALNSTTNIEGVGYLATTAYGAEHGIPRRALAYWWK